MEISHALETVRAACAAPLREGMRMGADLDHRSGEGAAIDEQLIERLVRRFYDLARRDDVLGPVFTAHVADWEPHLMRMCAFWSAIMRGTRNYQGRPMQLHAPLPIEARHFDRWLDLFEASAAEICPPHAAKAFSEHARRIGLSLELGIAGSRGLLLKLGERLPAATPHDET